MTEAERLAQALDLRVEGVVQTGFMTALSQAAAELRRLQAENDALRADAERYRWLRDEFRSSNWYSKFFLLQGAKFDAAIDAARQS